MHLDLPDDARWAALFGPVSDTLARALARLGADVQAPRIHPGTPGIPWEPRADGIALDPSLLEGPLADDAAWAASAPPDLAPLALDRWRRAAGAVLEGAAWAALDEEPGAPPWWRRARASEAADRAAPELGLLWPALVDWHLHPERGATEPGRGAWLARWRAERGEPRWKAPDREEWLAFGAWLFDPRGAARAAPLLPSVPVAEPGRWDAGALSFRRVRVRAGPAGARLAVRGGEHAPVALRAGEVAVGLVGVLAGGEAEAAVEPAGPVGSWRLRAGRAAERFGAARGIELQLRADGVGEVTLADAFIGPATEDALSLAAQYGVSGTLAGSWRLVGIEGEDRVIELGEVRPVGVTVHPRGRFAFAIPAGPFLGRAEGWLRRVGGTRWRVRPIEEGVEAEGSDLGPTVVLRFGREE